MLETDGYLRIAANNYQQAESHLKDIECDLRQLLKSLEKSVAKVEPQEPSLWEQMERLVTKSLPTAVEG